MKLSIITVVRNGESTIRAAIESVINQSQSDVEYIIIDGNSSDSTLSIINQYKEHISKVVSEQDEGIYFAMNKGIDLASGDIIGILNADDFYNDSSILSEVVKTFERSGADGVYGDLLYVDQKEIAKIKRYWIAGVASKNKFVWGWMPPHPSFFLKKEVYDSFGKFDTTFKSAADYELMLRVMIKHNIQVEYIPRIITHMRTGGVSNSSLLGRLRANAEDRKAWEVNGLKPYFFTTIFKPLRKLNQYWKRP